MVKLVRLLHITSICLSPIASHTSIITLKCLVAAHNQDFVEYDVNLGGFLAKEGKQQCCLSVDNLKYHFPQIVHSYQGHIGIIIQGAGGIYML
jgi:hypothetical protein